MRLARPRSGERASSGATSPSISASIRALDLVGQLVAVRPEQLDAVVLVGVVRGGDHHAEVAAHRAGQHRDRRRRHRAEQQHVHADRGEAGDQRIFDHVARQARVLADHHPVAMLAALERQAGRLADLQRDLGGDLGVGPAANAVGAEIFARHRRALLWLFGEEREQPDDCIIPVGWNKRIFLPGTADLVRESNTTPSNRLTHFLDIRFVRRSAWRTSQHLSDSQKSNRLLAALHRHGGLG